PRFGCNRVMASFLVRRLSCSLLRGSFLNTCFAVCGLRFKGQRAWVLAQALPGEQNALHERAVPAALLPAGAAPGPGPAFEAGRPAHEHAVDQAVLSSGSDRDARCEVPGGERVDRPLVVMGGQDNERLDNGLKRREGEGWRDGHDGEGRRAVREVFENELVES